MTVEGGSVPTGIGGLELGERGLRDERPQRMVIGLRGDHRALLLDLGELVPQLRQARAVLRQPSFREPSGHPNMLGRPPADPPEISGAIDDWPVGKCPESDSNRHWTVFETAASAVGLPGRRREAIRNERDQYERSPTSPPVAQVAVVIRLASSTCLHSPSPVRARSGPEWGARGGITKVGISSTRQAKSPNAMLHTFFSTRMQTNSKTLEMHS